MGEMTTDESWDTGDGIIVVLIVLFICILRRGGGFWIWVSLCVLIVLFICVLRVRGERVLLGIRR
jgi:O-antigen ligase